MSDFSPESGIRRPLVIFLVALLGLATACGGEGDDTAMSADAAVRDSGIPAGPDEDGDEWPDDIDNCPTTVNHEQRDRDRDGIGDKCDSCPSIPNNGAAGQVAQSGCNLMDEVEPNDTEAGAQAISLMPMNEVVAIRGTIEAPQANQAFDRYMVMVPAQTMLSVRVARASPDSLLEPAIEMSGGAYTITRTAQGLFVAERQFYVSEAGTYTIGVSDRRGAFFGEPKGSPDYAYELSVRVEEANVTNLSAPPFQDRPLVLERGKVSVFSLSIETNDRMRVQATTPLRQSALTGDIFGEGPDPIVILERDDGTVWGENHTFVPTFLDARILTEVTEDATVRVIVDYTQFYGEADDVETPLTVDYPALDEELEPNDLRDLASPLMFCPGCVTSGFINEARDRQPDVDWYVFEAEEGRLMRFNALPTPNGQIDPLIAVGVVENGDFVPMYVNGDSSGTSSRIDAIFPETGTYYLGIVDEQNLSRNDPPYRGGGLYGYNILTEAQFIFPAEELTTTSSLTDAINPGGRLNKYLATVQGATRMTIDIAENNADLRPIIRVYGPGAVGQLAAGESTVTVMLPGAGSYVIGVHNGEGGLGGPDFDYDLTATFTP